MLAVNGVQYYIELSSTVFRFIVEECGPRKPPSFPTPNVEPVPNWTPAKVPTATVLQGRLVRLEKLDPAKHGRDLFVSLDAPGPAMWEYMLRGPFKVGRFLV